MRDLAYEAEVSLSHFIRAFKASEGVTPIRVTCRGKNGAAGRIAISSP